ncbi:MAG: hypothetical protein JXQ87_05905 [Bacteroidia bacterium]
MKKSIYIGWDVGGMHGANNALAVLEPNDSRIEILDIKSYKKPKTAEELAQSIALDIIKYSRQTAHSFLAIDAPLRFPNAFVEQMKQLNEIKPLNFYNQIANPLAYRESETYLFEKTQKRPLSSTFDQLTSLTFLVLRVFQILKDENVMLNQMPFDGTEVSNGLNAFECYPGNLKPGKTERDEQKEFWNWATPYLENAKSEHQKDALLCALFAAHEANKNKGSRLKIEEGFISKASTEGWIYGFY